MWQCPEPSAATRAKPARSGVKCETVSTRFMFFRRNYITLKVGSRARPGFSSRRCRAVLPDPGQCVPVCVTVCLAPARLPAPSPSLHRGFMAAWTWCLARPATGSASGANPGLISSWPSCSQLSALHRLDADVFLGGEFPRSGSGRRGRVAAVLLGGVPRDLGRVPPRVRLLRLSTNCASPSEGLKGAAVSVRCQLTPS